MDKILLPFMVTPPPAGGPRPAVETSGKASTEQSFSSYVERKVAERQQRGENLLGVRDALPEKETLPSVIKKIAELTKKTNGQLDEMSPLPAPEMGIVNGSDELAAEALAAFMAWGSEASDTNSYEDGEKLVAMVEQIISAFGRLAAGKKDSVDDGTLAGLLAQMMRILQEMSTNKMSTENEFNSGQWSLMPADSGLVRKIAESIAMEPSQIASLLEKMQTDKDGLSVEEFFAALEKQFSALNEPAPVLIPETEIPSLENMLNRMGIAAEEIAGLTEKSLTGEGAIDLKQFVATLEELKRQQAGDNLKIIQLSDLDLERLKAVLQKAGVPENTRNILLWDRITGSVEVDLERLTSMLKQGLEGAKAVQPQVELATFVDNLSKLLSQAGFQEKSGAWTPIIEESLTTIHEALRKLGDLKSVSINRLNDAENMFTGAEKITSTGDLETTGEMFSEEGLWGKGADTAEKAVGILNNMSDKEAAALFDELIVTPETTKVMTESISLEGPKIIVDQPTAVPSPDITAGARLNPLLEQQALAQVSQGVLRGLQNNEHHLVLRLQPPELGEVKVELHIKDDKVAISFAMENSKVKEIIESNMEQFREKLGERGFNLGDYSVSVGQDNEKNERWEQMFFAKQFPDAGAEKKNLAEIDEDALYNRPTILNINDKKLSLFV